MAVWGWISEVMVLSLFRLAEVAGISWAACAAANFGSLLDLVGHFEPLARGEV